MTRPVALYPVLAVLAGLTMLPFAWVLSGSLRTTGDIQADPGAWLPDEVTLDNFGRLFTQAGFGTYLVNSIVVAAMVVVGNVAAASAAGYALAKLDFAGKRLAFGAVLAALMVPFSATFVPQFVVTVGLGLVDTLQGIALPSLVLPVSVFIVRQFAGGIPDELLEAARIDGAGELRIFWSVAMRLLAPGFVTVLLFQLVHVWHNYFLPLIVLNNPAWYPLTVGLKQWNEQAYGGGGGSVAVLNLVITGSLLAIIPLIAVFLVLQRYWQSGLAMGGVKQ